jgi:sodium-dependent phosphate cotransporter
MLKRLQLLLAIVCFAALLYGFFLGLDLMGVGFKLFGKNFAKMLLEQTANPVVGLFIGILATSLVQSSSTTTSMTVALVAAEGLTIEGAIPIVMGANIGTSVTNTLVSLGHASRRVEFQRAFAGATLHDFFNWMAVLVLLPLEILTGFLARTSIFLADALAGAGGTKLLNPLRAIVRPTAIYIKELLGESGALVVTVGVIVLIVSMKLLVDFLKLLMSDRAERILHGTIFRSSFAAILAGLALTFLVQSSSITTSLMVPLIGAGIITLKQFFPYTIGANIGTTVTAMLASLSTGSTASIAVALSHLLFNLSGSLIIYLPPPVRAIPLALAQAMGRIGSKNRLLAVLYIVVFFYGLPLLLLLLTGTL